MWNALQMVIQMSDKRTEVEIGVPWDADVEVAFTQCLKIPGNARMGSAEWVADTALRLDYLGVPRTGSRSIAARGSVTGIIS